MCVMPLALDDTQMNYRRLGVREADALPLGYVSKGRKAENSNPRPLRVRTAFEAGLIPDQFAFRSSSERT